MIHVYIHYPTRSIARRISKLLLQKRLAACINFINQEDMYWWQGKIEQTKGIVTLAVTQEKHFKAIESLIKKHHPYSVPCILELPINRAFKPYEQWLNKETRE